MNWIRDHLRGRGGWQKLTVTAGMLILLALTLGACSSEDTGLQVGDQAPDFELESSDGEKVALSDYRGQPVLLYFHMALG